MASYYLSVLHDSVAEPHDFGEWVSTLDDADEDEGLGRNSIDI